MKINILADIENAIRTRNFKDMSPKTKKISIITLIVFVLFIMILFLIGGENSAPDEQISASYEQNQRENQELQTNQDGYTAPKIEQDVKQNAQQNQNASAITPPPANNPFVAQDKEPEKADASSIPDLSNQNLTQQEQEEAIKEIAKKQKPDDMIAFLKEAQNKFNFLKTQKRFKYDMKNYQVGDIFLWWEIEEITPVYIRFKDDDYSYNLRFLEDFE